MFARRIDDDTELRQLKVRDAEALSSLRNENREYLRQWLPWLDFSKTEGDAREFIKRSVVQAEENNGLVAGIWFHDSLAGVISLHEIDRANKSTSIGYWLSSKLQGRGLMTKACAALTKYAFDELGLNRVEVRCATGNTKSRAIPERLGFSQEGVARQAQWIYDHYVDLAIYGVLAEERRALRGE